MGCHGQIILIWFSCMKNSAAVKFRVLFFSFIELYLSISFALGQIYFENCKIKDIFWGNSLQVPWLGLCTLTAKGLLSVSGQGTKKDPTSRWCGQKKKKDVLSRIYKELL